MCSRKTSYNSEHHYISLPLKPLHQPDHCLHKLYKTNGKNKNKRKPIETFPFNSCGSALTGFWKTNCINICLPVQVCVEQDLLVNSYR